VQIKTVTTTTLAQCRINFSGGDWYLLRAKFRNDSMSVSHDVGVSCIQWAANNRQGRLPVGVAWSSMQSLQGEDWGLHYSGQACFDTPVQAVTARSAGTSRTYNQLRWWVIVSYSKYHCHFAVYMRLW